MADPIDLKVILDIADAEKAAERFKNDFITSAKAAAAAGIGSMKGYAQATDQEFEKLYQNYKRTSDNQAKVAKETADRQVADAKKAADEILKQQAKTDQIATESWEAIGKAAKDAYDAEIAQAKKAADAADKLIKERGAKMEKFANEARGFVGDVGDAVGALGPGLLGLSDSQQKVADKTIYMTEKGMALGASLGQLGGPLGVLVGSGIGAAAGGLLGYMAGNSELAGGKLIALAEASAQAEKTQRDLAKQIKAVRDQLNGVQTKGLQGEIEKFDIVDQQIKAGEANLKNATAIEKSELRIYEAKLGAGKADAAAIEKYNTAVKAVTEQENALKELKKIREETSVGLKTQAIEEAQSIAGTTAQLKDKTRAELDADLVEKKARFNKLKGFIAADAESLATVKTTESKEQLTKAIARNSEEFDKAKSEYEAASKALKTFADKGVSNAKAKVKELKEEFKDFNTQLKILNATAEGELNRSQVDPLFGIIGFTESDVKNMGGLMTDLEKDLGGAASNIANSFTEPLNTFDNFVKLGFNSLQSNLFAKTEMSLASAKVVGQAMTDVGNIAKESIAGIATESFNTWLETIATGEKSADRSFKVIAAAAIRNIGSQLVADGVKNVLEGSARGIASFGADPTAAPLVAVGGAEIAAGVGMGAAGARAQRRQGFGEDKKNRGAEKSNLGRTSNNNNGTQVQAPSIINLNMLALTDQRQAENVGKEIAKAQRAFSQGRA